MPAELIPLWNEALKIKEYLQKLRQSLVATGCSMMDDAVPSSISAPAIDDTLSASDESGVLEEESKDEVAPPTGAAILLTSEDLDLYEIISDKLIRKAKFLVNEVCDLFIYLFFVIQFSNK